MAVHNGLGGYLTAVYSDIHAGNGWVRLKRSFCFRQQVVMACPNFKNAEIEVGFDVALRDHKQVTL